MGKATRFGFGGACLGAFLLAPSLGLAQPAPAPMNPPPAANDDGPQGRASELRLGGPDGVAPLKSGLGYQIYTRRYLTGRSPNGVNGSLVNVEGDNAVILGPNFANYLTVQGTIAGGGPAGTVPAAQGGRQAIYGLLYQKVPTAEANANRNYVAGSFHTTTFSGDGGTSLRPDGGARGGYFGINPAVVLKPSARNVFNATAGEINVAAEAGSSVYYKSGLQIASLPTDRVQGTEVDAMLAMSNQPGAVGWKDGILFGAMNGAYPIDPKGYLLRSAGAGMATVSVSAQGVIRTSNLAGAGTRAVMATADGTLTTEGAGMGRAAVPTSPKAACRAGAITYDRDHVYICIADDTWRRAALTAW